MGFLDNNMFSSKSTNNNKTETNNISGGASEGATNLVASDSNVNFEVLDAGAIESSFEFAKESQAFLGQNMASVLGLVDKSIDAQGDIINAQASANANETMSGIKEIIIPLSIVSVVGLVIYKVAS